MNATATTATRAGYALTTATTDRPGSPAANLDVLVTERRGSTTGLRRLLASLHRGDTIVAEIDDIVDALDDTQVAAEVQNAGDRGVRAQLGTLPGVPCTRTMIELIAEADYQGRLGTLLAQEAALEGRGTPLLAVGDFCLAETPEATAAWNRARLLRSIIGGAAR